MRLRWALGLLQSFGTNLIDRKRAKGMDQRHEEYSETHSGQSNRLGPMEFCQFSPKSWISAEALHW